MGAGAVGWFFAARLARAGAHVTAVARPAHVDAVAREGLHVQSPAGDDTVPVTASADPQVLADTDVVLVTVKSTDTAAAAAALAPVIRDDTLVVSVQNGVDNAWRLREQLRQPVAPGVVYVSVEMSGPGRLRHNGGGRLIVGAPLAAGDAGAAGRLSGLVALCERAGIACHASDDVRVELWTKLTTNCAYNAASALTTLRYGRLAHDAGIRMLMASVVDEVAAVAAAEGVPVTRAGLAEAVRAIAEVMPGALSSTAQDLLAHRPTEVAHLNGFVARRGAAHGIATPVNQALAALVQVVEASREPR